MHCVSRVKPFKTGVHLVLFTPGLTLKNSTFCLHSVFICFVCTSEQIAIISVCSINWPVFIIEKDDSYCAVRTGSLNVIQVKFDLQMVQLSAYKQNINWESIMEFFLFFRLPARCQLVSGNSCDRASRHWSSWCSSVYRKISNDSPNSKFFGKLLM